MSAQWAHTLKAARANGDAQLLAACLDPLALVAAPSALRAELQQGVSATSLLPCREA